MIAEFSVTPIDKTAEGFSEYVALSLELIKASGLDYELTAMGTIVEGNRSEVFKLIERVHENMAAISDRVITHIKIDDRKGYTGRIQGKTESVKAKMKA